MRPLDPRLLRRARAARPFLVATAVLAALDTGLLVVQATAVGTALARVVESRAGVPAVRGPAVALLAATTARALLRWGDQVRAQRAAALVSGQLRRDLVERVLDDGRPRPAGEVALLATKGMDALEPYVTDHLTALVASAVVPVLLLVRIATADLLSAVLLAVTLPLVPLFMALVGRATGPRAEASWTTLRDLAGHLLDVAQGLPTLRLFGRDRAQVDVIDELGERSRRSVMAGLRASFLSGVVLELLSSLAVALVAVSIGFRLVDGRVGLSTAFLVLILTPECFSPLRRVGSSYHAALDGLTAAAEALDLVEERPRRSGSAPVPDHPDIRCEGVSVVRPGREGSHPAEVTLSVGPGSVVALVGKSGAGKSTLVDVLRGRVTPTSGTVTVNGRPLDEIDRDGWTDAVAWVPQRPVLSAGTVADNVALGAAGAGRAELAAVTGPLGIEALLDRPARDLSAGERQRVALARAVLRVRHGARLALLDEPSAHLDDATEQAVVLTVQRLAALHAAVVVVAHRPALLAAADRVVHVSSSAPAASPSTRTAPAPHRLDDRRAAAPGPAGPVPSTEGVTGWSDDAAHCPGAGASRWLARRLWPFRGRFAVAVAAGTGAVLAGLGLLATASWLLSRAAQHPPVLALATVAVVVRALALGKALLRYAERLASHDAVLRFARSTRTELFRNLSRLSPSRLRRLGGGRVLARLVTDLDDLQLLVLRAVLPPLVTAAVAASVAAAAAWVLPVAGVLVIGGLVVTGAVVPVLAARLDARSGPVVALERSRLAREVVDVTEAADELSAYGASGERVARISAVDARLLAARRRASRAAGIADATVLATAGALSVALLLVGAGAAHAGRVDVLLVPPLVLVGLSVGEITGGMSDAAPRLLSLRATVGRLAEVADPSADIAEPGHPAPPPTGPVGIEVHDLVLGWPDDDRPVLDGASFTLPAGTTTVLRGPSGAGKSTLAAALVRFLEPSAGSITVGGVDISTLRADDVRRLVGWCAQDAHLFDTDLARNLRVAAPAATDAQLWKVLAAVRLDDWARALPRGLATHVGVRGAELSGGEAQRLALARVLLADRPVVVLDEPTANLDPLTAAAVLRDLLAAAAGRTTLVITHRLEGTESVDRWLRLDGGRVLPGAAEPQGAVGDAATRSNSPVSV